MSPLLQSLKLLCKGQLETSRLAPQVLEILKTEYQDGLLNLTCDPRDYTSAFSFQIDYLIYNWARKSPLLRLRDVDPRANATTAYTAAELLCTETNTILRKVRRGEFHFLPRVDSVIHRARRKISNLLEGWSLDDVLGSTRFGPGATVDLTSMEASVAEKQKSFSVTHNCIPYALKYLLTDPRRFEAYSGIYPDGPFSPLSSGVTVYKGNRGTQVPKDAKTNRTISIEPTLNLELQLSVGSFLRKRLRKVGIDLNDQTINQQLAQKAYTAGFATVDLSSASDTVSYELVFELFPIDFAFLLSDLRSPITAFEDRDVALSKFSSMGNGFTFELESLIFWALASSVDESGWASVYGDDIILRQSDIPLLFDVLNALGFVVNKTKSFVEGDFYESCGKHYFKGSDVTPIYHKADSWSRSELIRMANRIRRLDYHLGDGTSCIGVLRKPWLAVVSELLKSGKNPCGHVNLSTLSGFPYKMPLTRSDGTLYEGDDGLAVCVSECPVLPPSLKMPSWRFVPKKKVERRQDLLLGGWLRTPTEYDYTSCVGETGPQQHLPLVASRSVGSYKRRQRRYYDGIGYAGSYIM